MKAITAMVLCGTLLLGGCGARVPDAAQHSAAEAAPEGATHDADFSHVPLTPEATLAAGIEVASSGPAAIRDVLRLFGTVRPNAERMREVAARYPGVVQRVHVAVGDTVAAGQVLAVIESNESLRHYDLTAPLAGIVTARRTNTGESTGDTALFTVTDLSSVWVELSLFARDLSRVRVGQSVKVSSIDGGLHGAGSIVYIAQLSDTASQTLSARVAMSNSQRRWAPGLHVTAEVVLGAISAPVAVRTAALQTIENRTVVFVKRELGFEAQPVAIGRSDGDFTEVRNGLSAGSEYAAANSFVLKSALGAAQATHDH